MGSLFAKSEPEIPVKVFTSPLPNLYHNEWGEDGPTHKKERIPSHIRDTVWITYYGNSVKGICYCCGKSINRYNGGWHASHVISSNKSGEISTENLRPCCPHCNLSMGNQNLYAYIRDKELKGPGAKNINGYFRKHPDEKDDKRTNNWGKTGKQ